MAVKEQEPLLKPGETKEQLAYWLDYGSFEHNALLTLWLKRDKQTNG